MKALQQLLARARWRERPRLPFLVGQRPVGSVDASHVPALQPFSRWLRVHGQQIELLDTPARDSALATMNAALREQGLIRAWRDETFALFEPQTLQPLALMERAATRFWGTLTLGAHATGFVRGEGGQVAALWIARRADDKATDPGLLDNLIGGGVPHTQSPREALLREAWEEAGLTPAQAEAAEARSVLVLERDIPEGLQHEQLHSFDLELPPGLQPRNQDGEVQSFTLMPPAQVLQHMAAGEMTVDAAVVTLDFLLRHRLLEPEPALVAAMHRLSLR